MTEKDESLALCNPVNASLKAMSCLPHEEIASAFKALGHPARIMILEALACSETCCCGEICDELPLAQSTVSQHLKVLREAGFIDFQSEGLQSQYRLNAERIHWLAEIGVDLRSRLCSSQK